MKYILKSSLEQIALVKVAATLWNQDDLKIFLADFYIPYDDYNEFNANWANIESLAIKNIAKLPLPKQIKEKILCFIRPVGFEILKWKQFHERNCKFHVDLPNEFCWMPQGTIDRKKTAEAMIKNESINIIRRYKLACIYCLEDDIPKLWEKMSENRRKSLIHVSQKELVALWTYHIQDEVDKMSNLIEKRMGRRCSFYQCGFEVAAEDGNRVATEYFLRRLTAAEKEESLVTTAESVALKNFNALKIFNECPVLLEETCSPFLCFLFSELNEEQQIEVLQRRPMYFLKSFLNWPMQIFFMQTVNRMWNFLDEYSYAKLLLNILGKLENGYKDFNYQKLFREVWEQTPNSIKRPFLSQCRGGICIVPKLLMIGDKDNIRLVLKDVTPEEKWHIITWGHLILQDLVNDENQWSLLKYFIKECLSSKGEMMEFKKFMDMPMFNFPNKLKFHSMLDDIIYELK